MIRWLGYFAIPIDLFLGNGHLLYSLYPAATEWYTSEVMEFSRVTLWIFVAFAWNKSFKPEALTVAWYCLNTCYDVYQQIVGTNSDNPSLEIIIFLVGAAIIHLYYFSKQWQTTGQNKK